MSKIMNKVREFAAGWEPALAAAIIAAVFALATQLGIAVGDLPDKVSGILAFIAVIAPLVAGGYVRQKVSPLKKVSADAYAVDEDSAPDEEFDNPNEIEDDGEGDTVDDPEILNRD